jgi:hypothetical protein
VTAELVERAVRNGARVRLKPLDYVQRFGPSPARCVGCSHRKPDEHDAGGRLDRLVLADIAAKASWSPATWGEGAWPSVPRIATRIGYCDRSVQYSLRRLVAAGFLELVERPGRSSLFRIVRHVEVVGSVDTEPEIVDDVGDNRAPVDESAGPGQVAPGGATVAPELSHLPTDHPPVAPLLGLGESDGAAAPAHRGAPMAPRRGDPPSAAAPPPPADVGAEPHRRMRRAGRAAEPAPPSYDDVAAALSSTEPDEQPERRLSRLTAVRTRRCPRCSAPPGEAWRGRGGPHKSVHADRRVPDVWEAARAGRWRPPRSPGEPAF